MDKPLERTFCVGKMIKKRKWRKEAERGGIGVRWCFKNQANGRYYTSYNVLKAKESECKYMEVRYRNLTATVLSKTVEMKRGNRGVRSGGCNQLNPTQWTFNERNLENKSLQANANDLKMNRSRCICVQSALRRLSKTRDLSKQTARSSRGKLFCKHANILIICANRIL